ncbi:MAG: hypothetical protein ACYDHP_07780 [Ferrimicrobium sp.]
MSQPDRVSVTPTDAPPVFWSEPVNPIELRLERPATLSGRRLPSVDTTGTPGPDQGYALTLFEQLFASKIISTRGESMKDITAGVCACAMARASANGRAPLSTDLEVVLAHYGLFGDASAEQIATRRSRLLGVAHNYRKRRSLVDATAAEL